jgi:hypothetical protein
MAHGSRGVGGGRHRFGVQYREATWGLGSALFRLQALSPQPLVHSMTD